MAILFKLLLIYSFQTEQKWMLFVCDWNDEQIYLWNIISHVFIHVTVVCSHVVRKRFCVYELIGYEMLEVLWSK